MNRDRIIEARREYFREYYRKNKERINEYQRDRSREKQQ